MEQAEWDKLLPAGMQWVKGRRIQEGDSLIKYSGKTIKSTDARDNTVGIRADSININWRVYCPVYKGGK